MDETTVQFLVMGGRLAVIHVPSEVVVWRVIFILLVNGRM